MKISKPDREMALMIAEDLRSLSPDQQHAVGILFGYVNAVTTIMMAKAVARELGVDTARVLEALNRYGAGAAISNEVTSVAVASSLSVTKEQMQAVRGVAGEIAAIYERAGKGKL